MAKEEEVEENFFDQKIEDGLKVTSEITLNQKVVRAIKNLQVLFNGDANKVMKQAEWEKATKENLKFLIDVATVTLAAEDKMSTEKVPKMFNKALTHPDE